MRKVLAISMVLATAIYGGRVEPQSTDDKASGERRRVHLALTEVARELPTRYLVEGNEQPKRPLRRPVDRNRESGPSGVERVQGQATASV
jgi:hypothetical protein